jgi:lipopolysaccharide transport system permease protein
MASGIINPSQAAAPPADGPATASAARSPAPAHRVDDEFSPQHLTVIEPSSGWRLINWRELYAYRDLLRFLTWRNIKIRYTQSAMGIGWAIIQPMFQMIMFTLIFGHLARVASDGVPYSAFSLVGLVAWTYFATALAGGANSLVSNATMLTKIYFPRLVLPVSDVVAKLFDFGIALVLALAVLPFLGGSPNWGVLWLPYLIVLMTAAALGFSLWLSALAVQFRDVNHAVGFLVQLLMYASPVVYPTSLLPETYHWGGFVLFPQTIYAINPMVGVIEGFRSALLGTRPMPIAWIALGTLTSVIALVTGALYFRNRERLFADVA